MGDRVSIGELTTHTGLMILMNLNCTIHPIEIYIFIQVLLEITFTIVTSSQICSFS